MISSYKYEYKNVCLNKNLQRHQKNAICVSFTQVETNCDNILWLLCKCLYKNPCIRDLLVYENENVVWYMHECDTTNIKNLKNLQNQVPITDDCENYLMNVSLVLIGQFSAINVYQCNRISALQTNKQNQKSFTFHTNLHSLFRSVLWWNLPLPQPPVQKMKRVNTLQSGPIN